MVKQNLSEENDKKDYFNRFIQAQTCHQTFVFFLELCDAINLHYPPSTSSVLNDHVSFYPHFKKKLLSLWKAKSIFTKLDKRFEGAKYFVNSKSQKINLEKAGKNLKTLIIGAGPCGLRTAIELACLGAKVVVVEKRRNFSRNNVLHLWPFLITDLKTLGAKKIYGRFCAGSLDHISIRQLQLILLKVSLMLGVEIIFNVTFVNLIPPGPGNMETDENEDLKGWRAAVHPNNHPISNYEFEVIVGADGKRNTLQGFKRKEFRGKLAIGLTVNFINKNTTAEARVEEISGVAYIYNQEFFQNLHRETGIDLENIVYYKDDTHYFVMTAKKHSLLAKGVLKQDYNETSSLLSYENVDNEKLMAYSKEAADFSTKYKLPNLEFAINQFGQPDVALFDFTCMYAAENAALFYEKKGFKLLNCLVGDSLLEPFWPLGTGCARGFLAAFDLVWMIRQWCLNRSDGSTSDISVELEVMAERESVYRLLHQTTPYNMVKDVINYSIDPASRYKNLNLKLVKPNQVSKYYISDRSRDDVVKSDDSIQFIEAINSVFTDGDKFTPPTLNKFDLPLAHKSSKDTTAVIESVKLLLWSHSIVKSYDNVKIKNLTSSWKNGLAFCAIIHRFRPDLIEFDSLDPANVEKNNQLAFDIAEQHFGIPPVMTGKEMAECKDVDQLLIVTYISQFYEMFNHEVPTDKLVGTSDEEPTLSDDLKIPETPDKYKLSSPIFFLARLAQRMKRLSSSKKGIEPKRRKSSSSVSHVNTPPPVKEDCNDTKEIDKLKTIETNEITKPAKQDLTVNVACAEVKLRQKDIVRHVHQRASDRISALSSQLMSQWEQNSPCALTPPTKRQVDLTDIPVPSSSFCCFCNERIHVLDRLSAEGRFFHRSCFLCSHCGATLRIGFYYFVEDTEKFFCNSSCCKESKSSSVTSKPTSPLSETLPSIQSVSYNKSRSYKTPERIELENIRLSMLNELKELSEEDMTRHNLLSESQAVGTDTEEEFSDISNDDDVWMKDINVGEIEESGSEDDDETDESYELRGSGGDDSPADINTDSENDVASTRYDPDISLDDINSNEKENVDDADGDKDLTCNKKELKVNSRPESTLERPASKLPVSEAVEEFNEKHSSLNSNIKDDLSPTAEGKKMSSSSRAESVQESVLDFIGNPINDLSSKAEDSSSISSFESGAAGLLDEDTDNIDKIRVEVTQKLKSEFIEKSDFAHTKIPSDHSMDSTIPVSTEISEHAPSISTKDLYVDQKSSIDFDSHQKNPISVNSHQASPVNRDSHLDGSILMTSNKDDLIASNSFSDHPQSKAKKRQLPQLPVANEPKIRSSSSKVCSSIRDQKEKKMKERIERMKATTFRKRSQKQNRSEQNIKSFTETDGIVSHKPTNHTKTTYRIKEALPLPLAMVTEASSSHDSENMGNSSSVMKRYNIKDQIFEKPRRRRLLPSTPTTAVKQKESSKSDSSFDSSNQVRKPKKIKRKSSFKVPQRILEAIRRQEKFENQQNLRRAQVIQRQLEEVEVKQSVLEKKGVELENLLRSDGDIVDSPELMTKWFKLTKEKNDLIRYENELMIYQRELQLEIERTRLQRDFRKHSTIDDRKKTSEELAEQKKILQKMIDIVDEHEELLSILNDQKKMEENESFDLETIMLKKVNSFNKKIS